MNYILGKQGWTIQKTQNNYFLILLSFFSISGFVVVSILECTYIQYIIGLCDIALVYFSCILKLLKRKDIKIVEIFIIFFCLYVVGTYVFFNSFSFSNLIREGFSNLNLPKVSSGELVYLNTILFVYTKILQLAFLDWRMHQQNKGYKMGKSFDLFPILYFGFFMIYLFYLNAKYSNYYDFIEDGGHAFGLISYGSMFGSILFIISNQEYRWNKKITVTILLLICMMLLAKVGSRGYAILLLYTLLIGLKKRGLKLGNRIFIYMGIFILFGILYQGLTRIGLNGLSGLYNILVLFGEFFLPAFSYYYFVINPENVVSCFPISDFILRLLPTSFLQELAIDQYIHSYMSYGISVAPAGGFFFYGQIYYYFGICSLFIVIFLSLFLVYLKYRLENRFFSFYAILVPMIFYIIPRQLLCLVSRVSFMIPFLLFFLVFALSSTKRFRKILID